MSEREPDSGRNTSPEATGEQVGEQPSGSTDGASTQKVEVTIGKKTAVVSLRFPEQQLAQIQAYAAIMGVSANQVIRDGCEETIVKIVNTEEFKQQAMAYIARAIGVVDTAQDGGADTEHSIVRRLGRARAAERLHDDSSPDDIS